METKVDKLPEKRKLLLGRDPQSEIGLLSGVLRRPLGELLWRTQDPQRAGKPLCLQLQPLISCYFRYSKICISKGLLKECFYTWSVVSNDMKTESFRRPSSQYGRENCVQMKDPRPLSDRGECIYYYCCCRKFLKWRNLKCSS